MRDEQRIAALFVEPQGVYSRIPYCCLWDRERDARRYTGDLPVICHPPCARWGRYATVKDQRLGDDEGCGAAAVDAVRRCGGVLEHPAHSHIFDAFGLPAPGEFDSFGGYTAAINQYDYGHKAIKPTWLYCVNCQVLRLAKKNSSDPPRPLENLSKKQRLATPLPLALVLVHAALQVEAVRQ